MQQCMKSFILVLFFWSIVNTGAITHPPVEIIIDLEKQSRVKGMKICCDIPPNNEDFYSQIEKVYGHLYTTHEDIKALDIEKIREHYNSLLKCSIVGKVIFVHFNLQGFVELFDFNKDLLRAAFENGPLPFVINYNLQLTIQETEDDEIMHKVVFGRFFGGNPIINDTTSGTFVHLQDANNASQMVLTKKERS